MKRYHPIPGHEGSYAISEDGFVYSYISSRVLKFRYDGAGYKRVSLRGVDRSIHRLLAEVFLETWDPKLEVNHKDGDKLNNVLTNLEMVSHKENIQHAFRIGLVNYHRGEDSYLSKLSESDVISIRTLHKEEGLTPKTLSALFDCGRKNISEILRGKSWRHLL